jgi:hypothetical protein
VGFSWGNYEEVGFCISMDTIDNDVRIHNTIFSVGKWGSMWEHCSYKGSPISPYLFLICTEVLSSMLTQANREGSLTRVPTSKFGPRVSHLFFADDSLLFCWSSIPQWNSLTNLLHTYEESLEQRLNNNKIAIIFSKNTSLVDKEKIVEIVGILVTQ